MLLLCTLIGLTGAASFVAGDMASDPEVQIFFRSLVGASIGAFVGLSLWPGNSLRQNSGLIAVNLSLGALAGPTVYLNLVQRELISAGFIHMVACGGATSAFGMAILRLILPHFPKVVEFLFFWLCPPPLRATLTQILKGRRNKKKQATRDHLP